MHIAQEEFQGKQYKVANGTYYGIKTPDEVIRILEQYRGTDARLRIFCGDTATGKAWTEEWNIIGTIGRSTGRIKIPLLIAKVNSMGGPGLLEENILAIRPVGSRTWLYRHPNFDLGTWTAAAIDETHDSHRYQGAVYHNGELYARCTTLEKAVRLAGFMAGKRDAK